MKNILRKVRAALFCAELDFRVRIFNMLASAGMIISLMVGFWGLALGAGAVNFTASMVSFALAAVLLVYANKRRQYERCYLITIAAVFMILFPVMFFSAGGYRSGMSAWFVFAIVFTVFMLEGKKVLVIGALEMGVYAGICILAFRHPQWVHSFPTEREEVADIVLSFIIAGALLGFVMYRHFKIYRDEQRRLRDAEEQALRQRDIKSAFLANMSHEIRNPINVILGMNEMVLWESEDEIIAAYSRKIRDAGKSLMGLINNVLDAARIEAGKEELNEETYRTADLVRELFVMGSGAAAGKGIAFTVEADEALPSVLYGDFTRIKQIGANFLSNAVKYTERGKIVLSFTGLKRETGFVLRLAVQDTGVGIKKEHIPLLFNAFTRLEQGRTIEGSGLGLSIAKAAAELMGGALAVESEWGRGSIFSGEVPQKTGDGSPMGNWETGQEGEQGGSFTAPEGRVLVVDDYAENRMILKDLLKRTLLQVDTAESGAECLAMVKKQTYHVIIMDYMMPDMDGIKTFKKLWNEIAGFNTPVIALTAHAVAGMEKRFLDQGFAGYLSKPVLPEDLEHALLRFLPSGLVRKDRGIYGEYGEFKPKNISFRDLTAAMADQGVLLEQGLKYFSRDRGLYREAAMMFAEKYPERKREMAESLENRDWAALKLRGHSLKSNAKNIGAEDVSETAAKLEKYCAAGKADLISRTLELLFVLWDEAVKGLEIFIGETDGGNGRQERGNRDKEELAADLLEYLQGMRLAAAKEALADLLRLATEEERMILSAIGERIGKLEYREAEKLFTEYLGRFSKPG
ncbi:MAG: response regulator [Treponema sp.]|jgi:signal transduction histidine kinase/HPt (histidine-containing phosphotransfer) domain-containing protein/ActR/RegA family two-component response regulator|nr:response regulator [Treponema sp.]